MPQKAAVEKHCVGHIRLRVTKMMARNGLYRCMARDKASQASMIQNRNIVGPMNRGKTIPKLAFEDGRDGATTIFKNVVVDDQESRRRNRYPEIHAQSLI